MQTSEGGLHTSPGATTQMKRKLVFWLIIITSLILIPATVLKVTPLNVVFIYHASEANLLMRVFALASLVAILLKIAFGTKWLTTISFILFFVYLLCMMILGYFSSHTLDPFYVFTNFCGYCSVRAEYFLTLGRFAFWILFVGSLGEVFKWRYKLEVLDYLAFVFVWFDFYFTIPDFKTMPFYAFSILALIFVIYKIAVFVPKGIAAYKKMAE